MDTNKDKQIDSAEDDDAISAYDEAVVRQADDELVPLDQAAAELQEVWQAPADSVSETAARGVVG